MAKRPRGPAKAPTVSIAREPRARARWYLEKATQRLQDAEEMLTRRASSQLANVVNLKNAIEYEARRIVPWAGSVLSEEGRQRPSAD